MRDGAVFRLGVGAAILVFVGLAAPSVSAQQTGTGTGTGTADGTGDTGSTIGDPLSADTAFQNVERTGTVGAASNTVGSNNADGQNNGGGLGGLGGFGGGGFGGLGGLGSLFGGFNQGGGDNADRPIRTRLRSAIRVAPLPTAVVQVNASRRFQSLASRPALRSINVVVNDRTAVLRGIVPSEEDRRMSELLIRLEPGINRVDNQVEVAGP